MRQVTPKKGPTRKKTQQYIQFDKLVLPRYAFLYYYSAKFVDLYYTNMRNTPRNVLNYAYQVQFYIYKSVNRGSVQCKQHYTQKVQYKKNKSDISASVSLVTRTCKNYRSNKRQLFTTEPRPRHGCFYLPRPVDAITQCFSTWGSPIYY